MKMIKLNTVIFVICIFCLLLFTKNVFSTDPDCQQRRLAGDYNCDAFVDEKDYIDWSVDIKAVVTELAPFEYWRRVYYDHLPTPTLGISITSTAMPASPTPTSVVSTTITPQATETSIPATNTPIPPTNTPQPATHTPVPPTNTPIPQNGICHGTKPSIVGGGEINLPNNTSSACECITVGFIHICAQAYCSNCASGICECGEIGQMPPYTFQCSNGGTLQISTCTQ